MPEAFPAPWRLHISYCWDTSLHFTLFFLAVWPCLELVTLSPRTPWVCYSSGERQHNVRRKKSEGEKIRERRKGGGEMLMSCPVQYPYLWSGGGHSLPHCDARIHETVGGTPCRSESTLSLVFLKRAYPHRLPYTDNINISCLVSNHAWGIPPHSIGVSCLYCFLAEVHRAGGEKKASTVLRHSFKPDLFLFYAHWQSTWRRVISFWDTS